MFCFNVVNIDKIENRLNLQRINLDIGAGAGRKNVTRDMDL